MLLSLSKFYAEDDGDDGPFGVAASWVCPGCRGVCSCAACKRHASKREARERKRGAEKRRATGLRSAQPTRAMAVTPSVAAVFPGQRSGGAVSVSAAVPLNEGAVVSSRAISAEPARSLSSSVLSSLTAPTTSRESSRRSPRLQQRALVAGRDMGRVQDGLHALPMASSSAMSSSTSPVDFLPPHELSASVSASSPSPLSTTGYGVPAMSLSSPSAHYPSFGSFPSPLLPPSSLSFSPIVGLRRSPRVAGRALSQERDWRTQFAF